MGTGTRATLQMRAPTDPPHFHRGAAPLDANGRPSHAVLFTRDEAKCVLVRFRELGLVEASVERAAALVAANPHVLLQAELVPRRVWEKRKKDAAAAPPAPSTAQPVATHHLWYLGSADVVRVWGVFRAPFE